MADFVIEKLIKRSKRFCDKKVKNSAKTLVQVKLIFTITTDNE